MTSVLQVLGRSAGGIARHVAQIVTSIDGRDGFRIDIAGPPGLPIAMPKDMHDLVIPDGPVRGHRAAIAALRRLIDEGRYDVVHAHGLRAGIDASIAARRKDVPVFVTIHNLVRPEIAGKKKAPMYRLAEDLAVRLSDRTFAVSEDIARHVRRRVRNASTRVEVMHLGAGSPPSIRRRAEDVRRSLDVPPGDGLVLTASRLAPQKAVDVMLHAFAQLTTSAVLAIFGIGPLEAELRALTSRLDLDDRVRWLGFQADISDHLAAADAFCLSSIWEGVPLAAMEAVQIGTPVVATAVGGMPELIVDRHSGRLVEPRNPRALADALREVLTDDERRNLYIENARADLARNFSTERMIERLRTAYSEGARA
jgi:glycosyltransferase involved in cell wall biosynthesis